jgi:hypothetical protein
VAIPKNRTGGDGRRRFGAADLAIEVFESWVPALVRAVCEKEVCESWEGPNLVDTRR